jgi:hypothetical protein
VDGTLSRLIMLSVPNFRIYNNDHVTIFNQLSTSHGAQNESSGEVALVDDVVGVDYVSTR